MEPLVLCRRVFLGILGTVFAGLTFALALRADQLLSMVRRVLMSLSVLVALSLVALPAARANELYSAVDRSADGFVIHDATSTLHDYCHVDEAGTLWFTTPGGVSYQLITSTTDPEITNPGDGAFYPFDPAEVRAALAQVRYPLAGLAADIFILPYPRRGGLESAAGPGMILLAPGVLPLSQGHQHAEFTHELGHVVQYARMPDGDASDWTRYRTMRGIADASVYNASAPHADRPHEIFAEDFRALFGDPLANYSGSIENSTIEAPQSVNGLGTFLDALTGPPLPLTVSAWPNPARGAVRFARGGAELQALDLFDVSGRRVATLEPVAVSGGVAWSWDGRESSGLKYAGGVVFARMRGATGVAARVTILP